MDHALSNHARPAPSHLAREDAPSRVDICLSELYFFKPLYTSVFI